MVHDDCFFNAGRARRRPLAYSFSRVVTGARVRARWPRHKPGQALADTTRQNQGIAASTRRDNVRNGTIVRKLNNRLEVSKSETLVELQRSVITTSRLEAGQHEKTVCVIFRGVTDQHRPKGRNGQHTRKIKFVDFDNLGYTRQCSSKLGIALVGTRFHFLGCLAALMCDFHDISPMNWRCFMNLLRSFGFRLAK